MIGPMDFFRYFGIPGMAALLSLLAFLAALGWYTLRARTFRMTLVVFVLACLTWAAGWWNSQALARVEIDDSARMEAEAEARRQRLAQATEARREQAPGIRFAEDTDVDVLDLAGVAEAGSEEEASLMEEATPAYRKRGPQIRRITSATGDAQTRNVEVDAAEAAELDAVRETREARSLPPEDLYRAEDINTGNRILTRGLFWGALVLLLVHYLRNVYATDERVYPLPLPPRLVEMTARPPVRVRQIEADAIEEELNAILRRGETFLCCGAAREAAARLPLGWRTIPVTDCGSAEHADLAPAFLLEAVWYGRGAFFVPATRQVKSLIGAMLSFLHARVHTRARPQHRMWLLWTLDTPIPENWLALLTVYTEPMRLSILHVGTPGPARRVPPPPAGSSPLRADATPDKRAKSPSRRRAAPEARKASPAAPSVSSAPDATTATTSQTVPPPASETTPHAPSSIPSPEDTPPPPAGAGKEAPLPAPKTIKPATVARPSDTAATPAPPASTPKAPPKDRVIATCPHCGRRMKLLGSMRGKRIRCPDCKDPMRVPDA